MGQGGQGEVRRCVGHMLRQQCMQGKGDGWAGSSRRPRGAMLTASAPRDVPGRAIALSVIRSVLGGSTRSGCCSEQAVRQALVTILRGFKGLTNDKVCKNPFKIEQTALASACVVPGSCSRARRGARTHGRRWAAMQVRPPTRRAPKGANLGLPALRRTTIFALDSSLATAESHRPLPE